MKTYITHSDAEARGLHEGTVTLLVIPMVPQPTTGLIPGHLSHDQQAQRKGRPWFGVRFCRHSHSLETCDPGSERIVCPYAPGDVIGAKEAWGCDPNDWIEEDPEFCKAHILFRALWPDGYITINHCKGTKYPASGDYHWGWDEPEELPFWAIRTRLSCRSVEARMVQSITDQEIRAAGITPDYPDHICIWRVPGEDKACSDPLAAFEAYWTRRHPGLPFETAWAWFVKVEKA